MNHTDESPDDDVLREQLAYYDARAHEYDASLERTFLPSSKASSPEDTEWAKAVEALQQVGFCEKVLELAAGTGIWTEHLLKVSGSIKVLDGSPEMLAIHESKIRDARVVRERVDLFDWVPQAQYDLVFFAFWLSHVPHSKLEKFLDQVSLATRHGGRVLVVDEPAAGQHLSGPNEAGMYQERTTQDGKAFQIIKVYYDPATIQELLSDRGFRSVELVCGDFFFHLISQKI